ncbi:MAG: helix-turn-helix domain-containing protein [Planctomycetota bacterium]|nr:MAG: helix-turn-helix domain-containing protein [Planctomycetota bacterium]
MTDRYSVPPVFIGHLGERIRYNRQMQELTQSELARRADMNQGFLSEIERGKRRPSPSLLKVIADVLDVPPAVLIGQGPDHDTPQPLDTRQVPLLGSIPAGPPTDSQEQMEMFPLLRHLWAPDRYCLRLSLDSMEPTLKPGDIILVQYRPGVSPELVQGRICACLVDGVPTLKRVSVEQKNKSLSVILRGDNPAVAPIVIDDSHDFSIQGVVINLVGRDL